MNLWSMKPTAWEGSLSESFKWCSKDECANGSEKTRPFGLMSTNGAIAVTYTPHCIRWGRAQLNTDWLSPNGKPISAFRISSVASEVSTSMWACLKGRLETEGDVQACRLWAIKGNIIYKIGLTCLHSERTSISYMASIVADCSPPRASTCTHRFVWQSN